MAAEFLWKHHTSGTLKQEHKALSTVHAEISPVIAE